MILIKQHDLDNYACVLKYKVDRVIIIPYV